MHLFVPWLVWFVLNCCCKLHSKLSLIEKWLENGSIGKKKEEKKANHSLQSCPMYHVDVCDLHFPFFTKLVLFTARDVRCCHYLIGCVGVTGSQ